MAAAFKDRTKKIEVKFPGPEGSEVQEKPTVNVRDRRYWARAQNGEEVEDETDRTPYPTFVEQLKARTEAAEMKLKERIAQLEAEFQEAKARQEREVSAQVLDEKIAFLKQFLPLQDDITRALEAADSSGDLEPLLEGLVLIRQKMDQCLSGAGAERMEVTGKPFDPNTSEAISMRSVEDPALDGVVLEEIQAGFAIGDRLIQPAKVIVGRCESAPEDS